MIFFTVERKKLKGKYRRNVLVQGLVVNFVICL